MYTFFNTTTLSKTRFYTAIGTISIEELWDLPISLPDGVSLTSVATDIALRLKELPVDDGILCLGITENSKAHLIERLNLETALQVVRHIANTKHREIMMKAQIDSIRRVA